VKKKKKKSQTKGEPGAGTWPGTDTKSGRGAGGKEGEGKPQGVRCFTRQRETPQKNCNTARQQPPIRVSEKRNFEVEEKGGVSWGEGDLGGQKSVPGKGANLPREAKRILEKEIKRERRTTTTKGGEIEIERCCASSWTEKRHLEESKGGRIPILGGGLKLLHQTQPKKGG